MSDDLTPEDQQKLITYIESHAVETLRGFIGFIGYLFDAEIMIDADNESMPEMYALLCQIKGKKPAHNLSALSKEPLECKSFKGFDMNMFASVCGRAQVEYQQEDCHGNPLSNVAGPRMSLMRFILLTTGPLVDGWTTDRADILYDAFKAAGVKMEFDRAILL